MRAALAVTLCLAGFGFSGCAVYDVASTAVDVSATAVGTAADAAGTAVNVTGTVVSAPFGHDDSGKKKSD
jgi:hypothetical protein